MPRPGLLLLVDLDGVLYRGADPVPGVATVLATRAALGDDVVYVTNNSMWHRSEYVERIAGMGAPATADRIVSSPRATALYLRDHHPAVRHVLTVGASGMDRELEDAGFRVTRAGDIGPLIAGSGVEGTDGGSGWEAAGRPDAVVVGLDPHIDYLRLTVATDSSGRAPCSSLTSLEQLPITRVKLDRLLIPGVDSNPRSAAIVRSIVALCHGLGLQVVAEGVERATQLEFLSHCGPIGVQGFLLAQPVEAAAVPAEAQAAAVRAREGRSNPRSVRHATAARRWCSPPVPAVA